MTPTNDQYLALEAISRWYRRAKHQIIELSGIIGTGSWEVVQASIEHLGLDPREVMYLSYNQKQVMELAFRGYHTYYINSILYRYTRITDFNSLPVINPRSTELKVTWQKEARSKIDPKYRLIVVFDAGLLTEQTMTDLTEFGLPILLLRDPMLPPVTDSYALTREPQLQLREPQPDQLHEPLVYFTHRALRGDPLVIGNYDNVTVLPRKNLNLFNLKASDMNLTLGDELMTAINLLYREKLVQQSGTINVPGERLLVTRSLFGERLVNADNKKLKLGLSTGMIGHLTKLNKHAAGTRYVPCEFQPDGYQASFLDLYLDRYALNPQLEQHRSNQERPDRGCLETKYAYALAAPLARLWHWGKVTLIVDEDPDREPEVQARLMYLAMTRAKNSLTIIK